jgi:hypothetical protein
MGSNYAQPARQSDSKMATDRTLGKRPPPLRHRHTGPNPPSHPCIQPATQRNKRSKTQTRWGEPPGEPSVSPFVVQASACPRGVPSFARSAIPQTRWGEAPGEPSVSPFVIQASACPRGVPNSTRSAIPSRRWGEAPAEPSPSVLVPCYSWRGRSRVSTVSQFPD